MIPGYFPNNSGGRMGRKAKPPHEITLRQHKGKAVCSYRGKVYEFGRWEVDRPSAAAVESFQRQIAAWITDPNCGLVGEPSGTLADVWVRWVKSPHVPGDRRDELKRCARSLFGTREQPGPLRTTHADKLTAAAVLSWQDSLCRRGLSRYTVCRYVSLLKLCLGWGRVAGLVPAGVLADVLEVPKPPKGATRPRTVRSAAVVWDFARALKRVKGAARLLLRVQWYTGARPSELCGLLVGDVRRAGVVRPSKGAPVDLGKIGVWAAVLGEHKTQGKGGERCLFFGPRAQKILCSLLDRPPTAPLFSTKNGKPYSSKLLRTTVKLACRRAGVSRVTPYAVRHSVAERVQARFSAVVPGAGYLAAQSYLGHKVRGVTSGYSGSDWVTAARVAVEVG